MPPGVTLKTGANVLPLGALEMPVTVMSVMDMMIAQWWFIVAKSHCFLPHQIPDLTHHQLQSICPGCILRKK